MMFIEPWLVNNMQEMILDDTESANECEMNVK